MSLYRTKNRLLLNKIQAAIGTPETPAPSADAVLGENPSYSPNWDVIQTNESGASLDNFGPIVGGGYLEFTQDVYVKGAGAAGVAPEYASWLRMAAMAETLTAADISDSAQGGTTSSVTLHAGASATDDFYKGMVLTMTAGAANGDVRVITDYNGTTKVATVTPDFTGAPVATDGFTIYANALYVPASASLELGTQWLYELNAQGGDAWRRRMFDAAATFSLAMPVREPGKFSFTSRGILEALPDNVSAPATPTFDATRPRPFLNAQAFLGGSAIKFNAFNLDYGATVDQGDDPGALFGYDSAGVVDRRISGSINPALELAATRNNMSDFINGVQQSLWLRWGSTAGNRVSVFHPQIQYTGANPEDVRGFANENLPFEAPGFDDGVYLCVY